MSSIDAETEKRIRKRFVKVLSPDLCAMARLALYARAFGVKPDRGIEHTVTMLTACLGMPYADAHMPLRTLVHDIAEAIGNQTWARDRVESQLTIGRLAKSVGVTPQTIRRAADAAEVKRPDEGQHHSHFSAYEVRAIAEKRRATSRKPRELVAWNEVLTAVGERTLDKARKAPRRM